MRVRSWMVACALIGLVAACGPSPEEEAAMADSGLTDLVVVDEVVGDGAEAMPGQMVVVHYTGWLYHPTNADHKGREFDSSRTRGEPFRFDLGAGQVITGWDQGVAGMRVGGRRTLTIPASLGYGIQGAPPVIPPNATLVFDVELLDIG